MGREIDERVVEMKFDNQKFEENANQSIDTLKRLDKSLDFEHTGQSLDQIQNAANRLSFNPIATAIDGVQQKFSALEVMAIGAFMRIGSQIESTAERMIKSFTTDNIAAGWQKFGEKTNSVATLVSQGFDKSDVNEQMARLNWFTDETSYNFTDMVSNIAKFTATGQDLNTSVTAMEGIATWAALSGQNAQKASMAMYQLSQAMSKGALKYDDFKSIQNASMDTQEFRSKALEAAAAIGTIKKNLDDTYTVQGKVFTKNEMFASDALSRTQWFTSDVMMETFQKYSSAVDTLYEAVDSGQFDTASEAIEGMGDSVDEFGLKAFKAAQQARTWRDVIDATQDAVSTGWMQTFEYIFGDYEEATKLWTNLANGLYDIFAEPGNRRNEILKAWYGAGGRDQLIKGLSNIWEAVSNFTSLISQAWHNIFPEKEAKVVGVGLKKLTDGFVHVTEKIKDFFAPLEALEEHTGKVIEKAEEFTDDIRKVRENAEKAIEPIENLEEIARRVISGEFGTGETRFNKLTELYGSYEEIQNKVNELMGSSFRYNTTLKEEEKEVDAVTKAQERYGLSMDGLTDTKKELENTPSDKQIRRSEQVIETFAGIFGILGSIKRVMEPIVRLGGQLIGGIAKAIGLPFIDFILSGTSALGRFLLKVESTINNFTRSGKFAKAISTASAKIHGFTYSLSKLSEGFFGSLSDMFEKVKSSSAFERLADAFGKLWDVIKQWKDNIFGKISDGFNKLVDSVESKGVDFSWLESFINMIVNGLASAIEFIVDHKDVFESVFGMFTGAVGAGIEGVGKAFSFLGDGIKSIGDGKSILDWLSEKLSGMFDKLGGVVDKLTGVFKKFGDTIFNAFSADGGKTFSIDKFSSLLKNLVVMAFFGLRIFDMFKAKKDLFDIPKKLGEVLDSVTGALEAYQSKLKSEAIWNIAKSIGVLAASLFVLSLLDPNDVANAAAALFIVAGALALVMLAFAKIKEAKLKGKDDAAVVMLSDFLEGIKDAFAKAAKMIGMAAVFIGIAVAVGVIVAAIIKLKNQMSQAKDLWQAIGMVAVIMVALGAVATICSSIGKNLTIGDALSFIAIALSIKMILGIVNQVIEMIKNPEIGTEKLWQAIGMVSALGLVMGVVVMLARLGPGKGMLATAATILILGIVMKVLFSIVNMIAKYDYSQINQAWQGVTMMILLIGLITLLAYGAGNLSGMQTGASTLMSLVTVLALLGAVIVIVGKNAESGTNGMLLLAATLIVLIAAAAAAYFLVDGMYALATAVVGFGISAALIGVAALSIAAAFYIASLAIPEFFEGLARAGDVLEQKGPQIGLALLTIITIIMGVIVAAQPNVIQAISSLIGAISTGIANAVPTLLSNLWVVVLLIGAFLIAVMPEAVQMLIDIVISFWNSFADAIVSNSPRFLNAAHRMIYALWDVIIDVITELISTVSKTAADWFYDNFHADLPPVLEKAGEEAGDGLVGSFVERTGDKLKEAEKNLAGSFEQVTDNSFNDDVSMQRGYDNGEAMVQGRATGIEENSDLPVKAFMNSDGDITDYFKNSDMQTLMEEYGIDQIESEATGIDTATGTTLVPTAEDSAQKGVDGVRSKYDAFVEAGKFIAKGVAAGMSDKEVQASIEASGVQVGDTAVKSIEKRALVQSPSRVTMWIGNMIGEGLVIGMIDKVKDVKDSAKQMAEKGINAINKASQGIYDILNQDLDLNPVIRPVLDDSGIQNGIGNINGAFGRLALATGGSFTGNLTGIRSANNPNDLSETIDKAVRKAVGDITDGVTGNLNSTTTIEVPLNIDGRRVAKATAQYTRGEIARLDKYNSRKGGKV